MEIKTVKLQIRYDTHANWESANPILATGELGYESDTHTLRIGDGINTFTQLPKVVFTSEETE